MAAWSIIVGCLMLAAFVLWQVRRMDGPPTVAVACASLGSGGAVGMIALPIAVAGGATGGGVLGAGLLLAAVAAPLCWLLLARPRTWTPPNHGRPIMATETAAAPEQPARPNVKQYRIRSAAEAIAEAQGADRVRSASVRRIMDMEV